MDKPDQSDRGELVAADSGGDSSLSSEVTLILDVLEKEVRLSGVFGKEVILKADFGTLSLGDLIAWFIQKLTGESDFRLSTPWDFLNKLTLENFVLGLNLTKSTFSVEYKLNKDFVIITIESFTITMGVQGGKSLDLSIVGNFLGKDYTAGNPLSWDILNESPPAVPGKGPKLFDLQYLGIGQHVTLADTSKIKSAADLLETLQYTVVPVRDPRTNPLAELAGLKFSNSSNWLFGINVTFIEAVTLGIVFNDPDLYGMYISLSGPKVKIFAGLKFQILYKKVTDTIGVYSMQLKLPDIMRHLQFGVVGITLPVVGLDIYTNGNFRIDFGFPKGMDFSGSFAIQAQIGPVPVLGGGGFYFAVLDGATSETVPKTTVGSFSPVIEAGIGLQLGVGKTISLGPLSGGISITFVGILEGTLGWFHPDDGSGTELFYAMKGTFAIVGKVFATVDFVVIKASVSLVVYASAEVQLAAYEPITFTISAGVSVRVSLKIVFIRVHFSFKAKITETITMGSKSHAPWDDPNKQAAVPDARGRFLAATAEMAVAAGAMTFAQRVSALKVVQRQTATGRPDWNDNKIWPQPEPVTVHIAPGITVGQPEPAGQAAAASNGGGAPSATSNVKVALLLFVQNPPMPLFSVQSTDENYPAILAELKGSGGFSAIEAAFSAHHITLSDPTLVADASAPRWWLVDEGQQYEAALVSGDNEENSLNFSSINAEYNQLASGLLAFALQAGLAGNISDPQATTQEGIWNQKVSLQLIESLYTLLSDESSAAEVNFNFQELMSFLGANFRMTLQADTSQGATADDEINGTLFPMFSIFGLTYDHGTQHRDLNTFVTVDQQYREEIEKYFEQLAVRYQSQFEQPDPQNADMEAVTAETVTSVTGLMFLEYFQMLTRSVLQVAKTHLEQYPYTVADASISLQGIVGQFEAPPHVPPDEQLTPCAIVVANQSTPGLLNYTDGKFLMEEVVYQTSSGESLSDIAARFPYKTTEAQDIDGALLGELYRSTPDLLLTGVQLPLPTITYVVPEPASVVVLKGEPFARATLLTELFGVPITNLAPREGRLPTGSPLVPLSQVEVKNSILTLDDSTSLATLADRDQVPVAALLVLNPQVDNADQILPAGRELTCATIKYEYLYDAALDVDQGFERLGNLFQISARTVQAMNPDKNPPDKTTPEVTLYLPDLVYMVAPSDTDSIVQYFGVTLKELTDNPANQQVNFSAPLTPGTKVEMNTVRYAVPSGGTMLSAATYLGLSLNALVREIHDKANLLTPLTPLTIPSFEYPISADGSDTFNSIVAKFNISLDTLTEWNETQGGIFANNAVLVLPNVPQIEVRQLADELTRADRFDTAAAMISRFLLHGLRLPEKNQPDPDKIATLPYYYLTGQQIPAPIVNDPNTETYPITLTKPAGYDWIEFAAAAGTIAAAANEDVRYTFNLSPDAMTQIKAFTDTLLTLDAKPPEKMQLYAESPAQYIFRRFINWQNENKLVCDPTSGDAAANQSTGNPTIWSFPPDLANVLSGLTTDESFPVNLKVGATPYRGAKMSTSDVECYWWATTVDLRLSQIIPPHQTSPLPNDYLLEGTDEEGRTLLRELFSYLQNQDSADHTDVELYLAYPPNSTSAAPTGLRTDLLDPSNILLVKTNLSTMSHNNTTLMRAMAATTEEDVDSSATLDDANNFAVLVWEGSVVGTGGYYLRYVAGADESGLPGYLFTQEQYASLKLIAKWSTPGGPLRGFHNAAIVADNIDATQSVVFAEAVVGKVGAASTDFTAIAEAVGMSPAALAAANLGVPNLLREGETVTSANAKHAIAESETLESVARRHKVAAEQLPQLLATTNVLRPGAVLSTVPGTVKKSATIPPGNVGFTITRTNPNPSLPESDGDALPEGAFPQLDPVDELSNLYNLLSYWISSVEGDPDFKVSNDGLPLGPANDDADNDAEDNGNGDSTDGGDDDPQPWNYTQVLAVYPSLSDSAQAFRHRSAIAASSPCLPPPEDDPYRVIGKAPTISFAFQDIYGNRATPTDPPEDLVFNPLKYFDNVIGLAQWPSTAAVYEIGPQPGTSQPDGAPYLTAQLSFSPVKYAVAPGLSLLQVQQKAAADRATFARAFYQAEQDGTAIYVRTSLESCAVKHPVDHAGVLSYLGSSFAYLTLLGQLKPVLYQVANDDDTFANVAAQYSIAAAQLAEANNDAANPYAPGKEINLPRYTIVADGESPQAVADGYADGKLTVEQLFTTNASLEALQPGAQVVLGDPQTVPASADNSLQALVKQYGRFGLTAEEIAIDNQEVPLAVGTKLLYGDTGVYEVASGDTLLGITENITVTVSQLASLNVKAQPLFEPERQLTIRNIYVIQPSDTIDLITATTKVDAAQLAKENADNGEMLLPGSRLLLVTEPYVPQSGDTLAHVATKATLSQQPRPITVTVADIVDNNPQAKLNPQLAGPPPLGPGQLVVPGSVVIDTDPAENQAVYPVAGQDSFAKIQSETGRGVSALGEANSATYGLLAPNQPLDLQAFYDVRTTTVSLQMIADEFTDEDRSITASVSAIGQRNADVPGLLRVNAEIRVSDTASVPVQIGDTLAIIAKAHSVGSAGELAELNANTIDLFVAGASLIVPVQHVTRANETLGSAAGLVGGSAGDVAAWNQDAALFVEKDAYLMLPPAPFVESWQLTPKLPAAIFPLVSDFTIERTGAEVIDPNFQDVPAVKSVTTNINPNTVTGEPASSLEPFAEKLESVVSDFKVASGKKPSRRQSTLTRANALLSADDESGPVTCEATGQLAEQASDDTKAVWGVSITEQQPPATPDPTKIYYWIDTDRPYFFGLPPLKNRPQSGSGVPIKKYETGTGLVFDKKVDLQNVDLDVWGREFLEAVDRSLSPEYAVAVRRFAPAAFQNIMNYKRELADGISAGVTNILDAAGEDPTAVGPDEREAQEALRQRLLTYLATAYTTNAIVQYPVEISAPPPAGGDQPPRLSGKPGAEIITIGEQATLEGLASGLEIPVTPEYFTSIVWTVQRMLVAGQKIEDYTIQQDDSLASVAKALGLKDPYNDIVGLIGDKPGYLAAGFPLAVTQLTYRTSSQPQSTSPQIVASYIQNADPDIIVQANLNRPSILAVGMDVTLIIDGQPVTKPVEKDDTLYKLAAKFKLETELQLFAQQIANIQLFATDVLVIILQLLPDFSLSGAKVSLNPTGGSHITTLFSAAQPSRNRHLQMEMSYKINELEFDIHSLTYPSFYQSSSWLTFVIPLVPRQNWQVDVPIPLRSYPVPPSLKGQSGGYHTTGPLADVMKWDYQYTYQYLGAAQDTVYSTVNFNTFGEPPVEAPESLSLEDEYAPKNLFEALAQFSYAYPKVAQALALLEQLSTGAGNISPQAVIPAINAFESLVSWVATYWKDYWKPFESSAPTANPYLLPYKYRVRETLLFDKNLQVSITETESPLIKLKPPEIAVEGYKLDFYGLKLPEIAVEGYKLDPDGTTHPSPNQVNYILKPCSKNQMLVQPPGGRSLALKRGENDHQAFGPERTITMADLWAPNIQNAWASIHLTRNERLVSTAATNTAFVYSTPDVGFANSFNPFIVDNRIHWLVDNGTNGSGPPATNGNSLPELLKAVLKTLIVEADGETSASDVFAPFFLRVHANYGYVVLQARDFGDTDATRTVYGHPQAQQTGQALIATLPVKLIANVPFEPGDPTASINALANGLAKQVTEWFKNNEPNPKGGNYIFSIGFYSNLGYGWADNSLASYPIAEITDLQVGLDQLNGERSG